MKAMSMHVHRRPAVRNDLIDMYMHIARDNRDAAERFLDAVEATFKSVAEMPGMGTALPELNPRLPLLRRIPVKAFHNYVIYYVPTDGGIQVIRVLHAARNRDWLLKRE